MKRNAAGIVEIPIAFIIAITIGGAVPASEVKVDTGIRAAHAVVAAEFADQWFAGAQAADAGPFFRTFVHDAVAVIVLAITDFFRNRTAPAAGVWGLAVARVFITATDASFAQKRRPALDAVIADFVFLTAKVASAVAPLQTILVKTAAGARFPTNAISITSRALPRAVVTAAVKTRDTEQSCLAVIVPAAWFANTASV